VGVDHMIPDLAIGRSKTNDRVQVAHDHLPVVLTR
jgi:hypothetical protein